MLPSEGYATQPWSSDGVCSFLSLLEFLGGEGCPSGARNGKWNGSEVGLTGQNSPVSYPFCC